MVSFFFNKNRGSNDFTTTEKFASTIARQLARYSNDFRDALVALDLNQITRLDNKKQQVEKLVIELANRVKTWPRRVVIVIDGLDECDTLKDLLELVRKLLELPSAFVIFISCRPDQSVKPFFEAIPPKDLKTRYLDDVDDAKDDLLTYVRRSLRDIQDTSGSGKWPPEVPRMDAFAATCGKLFEIAAIRIRQIRDRTDTQAPIDIFNDIPNTPPLELWDEYLRILRCAYTARLKSEKTQSDEHAYNEYRLAVGTLITVLESMTHQSLADLVEMEVWQVHAVLQPLYPVMVIGDSDKATKFKFYHASFKEFLLSNHGSEQDGEFPISFGGARHVETLKRCLKNFQISDYGRKMWARHLTAVTAEEALHIHAVLKPFLEKDLFEWLEHMSSCDAHGRYLPPCIRTCSVVFTPFNRCTPYSPEVV